MTAATAIAPAMGHNRPPAYDADALAGLRKRVDNAVAAHAEWAKAEIAAQHDASKLSDFMDQVRKLAKLVDGVRRDQKAPHEKAAKDVDDAFRPLATALTKIVDGAKATLLAFTQREAERQRIEREKAAAEARAAAEAAEAERAKAQARGDLLAEAEAQTAVEGAVKAAKDVARAPVRTQVRSATGAGRTVSVRVSYEAEIAIVSQAFLHFRDRAEIREVLTRLANAEMRAADDKAALRIPGVVFHKKETIA